MNKCMNILLVEDHESDRRLVEEAIVDCKIKVKLNCLSDGEQAIDYVKQMKNKDTECPDLIILDLNMPRKDGHQFLEEVHEALAEREIPVLLLTVSDDQNDLDRAMKTRLNYFLSKPVNAEKLHEILSAVDELWQKDSCCAG